MIITADQAKTLLDRATPGPWKYHDDLGIRSIIGAEDEHVAVDLSNGDADLLAAAPALAQTVIEQAEEIERKKQALSTYGGVISTITRDLAKAIGHEDLLDEEGVHNQDIYEIAYEMIAEAREAREADQ